MAGGAFTNGPILEPKVEVIQNFLSRNPIVLPAALPVCIVGQHRQIEFEEVLGAFDAPAADVDYPVTSLTTYSATLVELDAITYIDENGDSQTSPSMPHVVFRHPTYGDATIPKNAVGTPGWSFNQTTGEMTIDKDYEAVYNILTGVGSYTIYEYSTNATSGTASASAVNANSGYREFTDADADFIGDGVVAGDRLLTADVNFTIIQVVNETTLIVQDEQLSNEPPTGFADDVTYTIEKTVNDGATIVLTYVANRGDLKTSLLTVDSDNFDSVMGSDNWLNPLGFYVNRAIQNTGTQVLAVQVEDADSQTSWEDAIDTLTNFEQPYGVVPLTQDEAILALFVTHVGLMSTAQEGKERRLIASYPLNITTQRAESGSPFVAFGTGGAASNHSAAGTATIRVTAGNNNIHVLGVKQGDVFNDLTPGFEGEARIVSVTPASPAADADVALVLATPNTWGLFGTQAQRQATPIAAQVVGCEFDVSAVVGANNNVISITVDGVVHTFDSVAGAPSYARQFTAGSNGNLLTQLQAYFGARFDITQPGGGANPVEVRETLGGFVTGPAVAVAAGATVEDIGGGGAVVTFVTTGLAAGVRDAQTMTIDDDATPTTLTFKNDQTTANGALIGVNNYAVQIGGPIMSAANVRDRIIEAINGIGLNLTAEAATADVLVKMNITGAVTDPVIGTVPAGFTLAGDVVGTGATNGSPITDWTITSKALTVDEQATAVAQKSRDLYNRRVINTWPDLCDEQFSDETAGTQLAQQGKGIFDGGTSIVQLVPNYSDAVAIAAFRSNGLASTPATKRQMVGPYLLRRVNDTYTKAQLDRILSTGTTLFEQLIQPGGTVNPVRAVTTDTTDLKFVEENVNAAVDKFAKTLRTALRGIFGPNLLDPDGNFLEMVSTKVQGVIDEFTKPGNREARAIKIISFRESETVKDRVEMDILYTPLFGANSGQFTIYV